jgi:hypothetical protein
MSTQANNTRIWHAHYTSSVQCIDGTCLPANIRIYSPMNDIPHADNTIAFVYARAHVTNDSMVLMDASHVVPCPGNPKDETYEDSVPDLPHPFVIALGHVSGKASHFPEGSHTFPLTVSDYVRDNTQMSTIRYVDLYFMPLFHHSTLFQSTVFNSARPRWKNTNIPFPGTIVLVIGQCARVLDRGTLAVDIENIVLNVPVTPNSTLSQDEDGDQPARKKKKIFRHCFFKGHPPKVGGFPFLSALISPVLIHVQNLLHTREF